MDILLLILGIICIIVGLAGCVLPGLPGPPVSYTGLLFLHGSSYAQYSPRLLWILALITIIVTVIDTFLPIWMTKKFGGTKYGVWGTTIGLIIGLVFGGVWGVIVFPFFGALAGELIGGTQNDAAFKSAVGSFAGFIAGTGAKLIVSGVISFYFIGSLWNYIVR